MLPFEAIGDKFWSCLLEIDKEIGARVAAEGCRHCGGPLHRGDFPRKARGGLLVLAESLSTRIGLCCGRRGCRRRSLPPSVRFLGRRVYVGAAVLIACVLAPASTVAAKVRLLTGVPARTVRRWRAWWQGGFVVSRLFGEQRGRFMPPLLVEALPASLLERFAEGATPIRAATRTLAFLSPLTTASVVDGARFVRLG
jgi:hypothetical protein